MCRDYYTIEELAGKQAGRLTLAGQLFKREDLVLVSGCAVRAQLVTQQDAFQALEA